ncbi:MAG: hypothetical protein U9R58_01610 [Chloroflexota bacterium]|nr:hypothetical protein [Chloroflexota bacterium]
MSDFITLQCPSCGGKLDVGASALSLKCKHCGAEHMIRRGAGGVILESYARCPVCNRNDKVEKVSAILRSQTHQTHGVTYQTRITHVKVGKTHVPVEQQVEVPIRTSQTSELAQQLTPPSQPQSNIYVRDGTSSFVHILAVLSIAAGIVSLIFYLCVVSGAVGSISENQVNDLSSQIVWLLCCGFMALLPIVTGIFLFVYAVPRERKRNEEKKAAAEAKRQALIRQADEGNQRWKKVVGRWKALYYCGRDDCVFLPGTNTHAPITQMISYLYDF